MVQGMRILKRNGNIIGKKILRNQNLYKLKNIKTEWILCWHGTHFNALESIMEVGLVAAGTKLKNGIELEPKDNHISRFYPVDGIDDWAKAVFVSPSILYAFDACYSERIYSEGERWGILVETRVKPYSFISRENTVKNYKLSENEPPNIEYRVECSENVVVT